mmetsp:Transcript_16470/g.19480  ORF Transcript_16470/g.19480 Transcript_16470/m.19480 type:complete len:531 (+) Transcript_16470:34-1626(+)|eukprot:CAMPEP_0114394420 /NCGR_PEP_ID=MMETSP0102-20121206/12187_1 /TAXON_ID=38822 ORGANISM="Pteridomonas danica, Strain PT" /NCGR_SAMPLE_ID=MMETSP0102 /ASSEMBLY_ACC=CAM_ASM_000212 /LENGTH=530 /DNA_ID=CAMNT_0001554395 /DNA_START=35 /DNA_END=1627 /DNA_ORIENTATION=-
MSVTNLFLSEADLDGFRRWRYAVVDNSFTTIYMASFWNWIVQYIPKECAPNVLTLAGFICAIEAFFVSKLYRHSHYVESIVASLSLAFAYFNLDALDGKHARNTKNSSPLGELFDHACDNMTTAMATVSLFWFLHIEDERLLWLAVQATSISFCYEHMVAFAVKDRTIRFEFFSGPGEAMILGSLIIIFHAAGWFTSLWGMLVGLATDTTSMSWPSGSMLEYDIRSAYVAELVILGLLFIAVSRMVVYALMMPKEHTMTKYTLLLFLCIRAVPAITIFSNLHTFGGDFGSGAYHPLSAQMSEMTGIDLTRVLADGMFMSILTSDLILSKMASRQLHPMLPVMALASALSVYVSIFCFVLYYITVFRDICVGLNLPLLSPVVNVYCDGVYDMLHVGHMKSFEQALKITGAHRLYVGVISDKVASGYKRPPIMNESQRYESVRACKGVYEVIEDCPLVATKEFIDKHNLHIYAVGEEYVNNPDDHYYRVPRDLNMLKKTNRTKGISTSELVKRILDRGEDGLKRHQPAAMAD